MTCHSAPTFLRFSTSNTRSPTGMAAFAFGRRTNTGNDDANTGCGTAYCPGDGSTQTAYSGLTLTTGTMVIKAPGDGCVNTYSNGGTDCYTCSPGGSDRSNCQDAAGANQTSQFAEAFYNSGDEREGVGVNCLASVVDLGANGATSGTGGQQCGQEGSSTSSRIYGPND